MPQLHITEQLMRFALFKGMGHDELARIVSRTKLDFRKYAEGAAVVLRGDKVDGLLLLIDGKLEVETRSADGQYTITEEAAPPAIIEPERLFGLHQLAGRSYTAATPASVVAICKAEVARLCSESVAFRFNTLNLLATMAQQRGSGRWAALPQNLRQRIARFVAERCATPSGRKTVAILMERLAAELNDNRLYVSQALHAMADEGLLSLSRGKISIPALERL